MISQILFKIKKLRRKFKVYQDNNYFFLSEFNLFFTAYSNVLSLGTYPLGIAFLLISFVQPNIGLAGLMALISAFAFFYLMDKNKTAIRDMYFYNSLLSGLFIGYLFQIDLGVVLLIICSSCLTLLITLFLDSFLKPYLLPVLSLPFIGISICIALSSNTLTNLSDAAPYFSSHSYRIFDHLPLMVVTFFRSIGAIFCVPDLLAGILIFLTVSLYSPLTAFFFVVGFVEGFVTESHFILNSTEPTRHFHYFNYSLIFAAIAGIYLTPSRKSIGLAAAGTLLATVISTSSQSFWSFFRVPIFSIPYSFTVLLLLRAIRTLSPGSLNWVASTSPERNLDWVHYHRLRYRTNDIGIFCPFNGSWEIQQGFDGSWTHQGHWRHALDFVVTGADGKTYGKQGLELSDYYAFGKDVLSPVEGYVVSLQASHLDHAIGQVNNQNNWGNYIVLKSLGGIFVLLAHLKNQSISVKTGDYISLGQKLGECGNTGYSKEPHLHLQVQLSPEVGYPTSAFHLLNYKHKDQLYFHGVPEKGDQIEPLSINRAVIPQFNFGLNLAISFQLIENGQLQEQVTLTHKLDPIQGCYYWTDGISRLNYSRNGAVFYFYDLVGPYRSALWDLMAAAPKIPLTYGETFSFSDPTPLHFSDSKISAWKRIFWKISTNREVHHFAKYSMNPELLEISGKIKLNGSYYQTFFKFNHSKGVQEFRIGEKRYVRNS